MAARFVSAPIQPDGSFDPLAMASGEPGLPTKFRWGRRDLVVAEVLERGREFGDCTHGSGERYVRRHAFRIRTPQGEIARIYFQRSFGKSRATARWWLQSLDDAPTLQA